MPYAADGHDVPAYVTGDDKKRRQWSHVWNSAYAAAIKDGKTKEEAEGKAFAEANGVAGPNAKAVQADDRRTQSSVSYSATSPHLHQRCELCEHFIRDPADCKLVQPPISALGWCELFVPVKKEKSVKKCPGCSAEISDNLTCCNSCFAKQKRVPFFKVDEAKREVWGIVTEQKPDKDLEVCDYEKSLPYYQSWVNEFKKSTDGESYGNLREMHQLSAVGRGIAFDPRTGDKQIIMGFKVVDDNAWKKVMERVYTGFSQGGEKVGKMVPDPDYPGCMRYVAKPSEVSLVDNPCLGSAHYTLIRADGTQELVKINGSAPAVEIPLTTLQLLTADVESLKKLLPLVKAGKTKRVAGEDLTSSAFAYVGDPSDTSTWKLPIKFSTDAKTKSHIRNALARFNQTQGIPEGEKAKVHARIVAAAKEHGIEVGKCMSVISAIQVGLRKQSRAAVNRILKNRKIADIGHSLTFLDSHLGGLEKGLYDAGRLAMLVQELGYMTFNSISEQEWEGDTDSAVPFMLEDNVNSVIDSLIAMVAEETQELRDELTNRVHPVA